MRGAPEPWPTICMGTAGPSVQPPPGGRRAAPRQGWLPAPCCSDWLPVSSVPPAVLSNHSPLHRTPKTAFTGAERTISGPSGWALSFPATFEEQWSHWAPVLLLWLRETTWGMGGAPQTSSTAVMLLSIMVATTATARLRENNNFNCVRIMGNQCHCTSLH